MDRARDIFLALRDRGRARGYDLTFIGLAVEKGIHDTPRAYGRYYPEKRLVAIAPELLALRDSVIRGILAHEIGHAGLISCLISKTGRNTPNNRATRYDLEERAADAAAKKMLGLTIYYGTDGVQRAGPGARGTTPRPRGLR